MFPKDGPMMSREWAMPTADTFSMKPVREFIDRWLHHGMISIDPFARNCALATVTNDLSPATTAQHHMDAEEFIQQLSVVPSLVLFDPPYSPRQISEVYQSIGKAVGMKETQNAALYKRVRDAIDKKLPRGGLVLSFGWNSNGMGKTRNYSIEEIMLVAHGGGHNDTICLCERKW